MLQKSKLLATFLIDYENVRGDGLKSTDVLKNSDRVIIFYSNCCNSSV